MRRTLPYHETATGMRVADGIQKDMARLNTALDSLRALAYRAGVAPLFSDGDAPRYSPWEVRESLICELSEGVMRMNLLRKEKYTPFLSKELQHRAGLLYHEICYQGNKLADAGYLQPFEIPQFVAGQHLRDGKPKEMLAYYENLSRTTPTARIQQVARETLRTGLER